MPEVISQDCQCDLSTESFEKLLNEQNVLYEELKKEMLSKDDIIIQSKFNFMQLEENFSTETTVLKEKLMELQVCKFQIKLWFQINEKLILGRTDYCYCI